MLPLLSTMSTEEEGESATPWTVKTKTETHSRRKQATSRTPRRGEASRLREGKKVRTGRKTRKGNRVRTGRPDPVTSGHAGLDLDLTEGDRASELGGEAGGTDGREDRVVSDGAVREGNAVDVVLGSAGSVGSKVEDSAVHDGVVSVGVVRESRDDVELAVFDEGAGRKYAVSLQRTWYCEEEREED
jgi:hypothetical protein